MTLAAEVATLDPAAIVEAYGPLGLALVSFVVGWAVPGWVHKRTLDRLEQLEERFLTEVIPALTRSADALKELTGPRQYER